MATEHRPSWVALAALASAMWVMLIAASRQFDSFAVAGVGQCDVRPRRLLPLAPGTEKRIVLANTQSWLGDIVEVARSPTMVIFDMPSVMLRRGEHEPVALRYAILVGPRDGRLVTLVWAIGVNRQGAYTLAEGPVRRLRPALVEDCLLDVDRDRFIWGIPTPTALAGVRLPSGTSLALPPAGRRLAAQRYFSAEAAGLFETQLRSLYSTH